MNDEFWDFWMPFWKCFYHVIWTTKYRQTLITVDHERLIFDVIRRKTTELSGSVLAINGMADHIHVAIALNPKISVAEWVKHCKGTTSYTVNQMFTNQERFSWQGGYGVLSCGTKALPFIVDYVQRQKEHHANNTLEPWLERAED